MPTMAAITIKKNDGTTDVVFAAASASGGDKSPAVWRSPGATGSTYGQRPEFRMQSRWNEKQTARRVDGSFTYPTTYTDASSGLTAVKTRANFSFSSIVPADMPDADLEEFGAQIGNLIASQLIEDALTAGYAPT